MTAGVDLVLLSAHGGEVWRCLRDHLDPSIHTHPFALEQGDSLAAMARSVLDVAPKRFALAGLCVGGYVALEIMAQAPERVTHLALLHTSARSDTEAEASRRARRIGALAQMAAEHTSVEYANEALPWMLAPAALRDPVIAAAARALLLETPIAVSHRQQTAMAARLDRLALLRAIDLPTLVVTGRLDRIAPPARSIEMAHQAPGARLAVLEACGHLSPLEQPRQLGALMWAWLAPRASASPAAP